MNLILLFITFQLTNQIQATKSYSKIARKTQENMFSQSNSELKIIQADNGKCGPNLFYSFQVDSLEITGQGEMYDFDFNLDSYSEPNSTTPWDSNKKSIISVSISSDATSIGSYAFYYFSSLKSIIIPENIVSIGSYAFSGCSSLTNITIPENVETIGHSSFSYCSQLQTIQLPSNLTSINFNLFKQ